MTVSGSRNFPPFELRSLSGVALIIFIAAGEMRSMPARVVVWLHRKRQRKRWILRSARVLLYILLMLPPLPFFFFRGPGLWRF